MIRFFVKRSFLTCVLAVAMCVTCTNYACNAQQWITTVGKYVPVGLQIAQSIVSLIALFSPNSAASDQVWVTQFGQEATADWNLVENLYTQYTKSPSTSTQTAIENALTAIVNQLPQELAAAHVKDADLLSKVTAAVNLMVTTADIIIANIPMPATPALAARQGVSKSNVSLISVKLTPAALKGQWGTQVCGGNTACAALVK